MVANEDTSRRKPTQNGPHETQGTGQDRGKEAKPAKSNQRKRQPRQPKQAAPVEVSPREWLELITQHAAQLRSVGVTYLSFGDCEVEIAPELPDAGEGLGDQRPDQSDPLNDPATFGGFLPSFGGPRQ